MTRFTPLFATLALCLGGCWTTVPDDFTPPADDDDNDVTSDDDDSASDDDDSAAGDDDSAATDDDDSAAEPWLDEDHDGFSAPGDCDDSDPTVNRDADEVCDGVDQDCDGVDDNGLPVTAQWIDEDGDGYGVGESEQNCGLEGFAPESGDCNDTNDTVYPGAEDAPGDGIDSDCDDETQPADTSTGDDDDSAQDDDDATGDDDATEEPTPDPDQDGDGFSGTPDCDDSDPTIFPGADEAISGIDGQDNDCDGQIDEVFEAFVGVEYPTSGAYQLNVQFYDVSTEIGAWWDATATVPSADEVSYTFLSSSLDLEGACGLRLNVTEGNPASGWLCQDDAIDATVQVDIWWMGVEYDEADLVVWQVPNGGGACSALLIVNTAAACQP